MFFSKSNVNPKLTPLLSSREGEQSIWAPVKNVVAFLCNIVVVAAIAFPAAASRNHDCDLEWKTRDKSGNSSGA